MVAVVAVSALPIRVPVNEPLKVVLPATVPPVAKLKGRERGFFHPSVKAASSDKYAVASTPQGHGSSTDTTPPPIPRAKAKSKKLRFTRRHLSPARAIPDSVSHSDRNLMRRFIRCSLPILMGEGPSSYSAAATPEKHPPQLP